VKGNPVAELRGILSIKLLLNCYGSFGLKSFILSNSYPEFVPD